MVSLERKRAILPWLSAVFCAFLSLITISANLWLSVANRSDVGGWAIAFLCFLPMCFFFVGTAVKEMQREISELRNEIAELRQADKE